MLFEQKVALFRKDSSPIHSVDVYAWILPQLGAKRVDLRFGLRKARSLANFFVPRCGRIKDNQRRIQQGNRIFTLFFLQMERAENRFNSIPLKPCHERSVWRG
jgi:hypothetical protein